MWNHNCFNPLWLTSHCSPDLYNGIWLLTSQKQFNFAKFQKNYEFFPCSLIQSYWENKKIGLIFYKINPTQLHQPLHMGGKILKIPLVSLLPKSVILCISCLTSHLQEKKSSNFWSFPEAYRGGGRRQKLRLDGATDFLSKFWHHTTTAIFVLIRKPANCTLCTKLHCTEVNWTALHQKMQQSARKS